MKEEKPAENHFLTTSEAIEMATKAPRKGSSFAISIRLDMRVVENGKETTKYFGDAMSGYVNVSRKKFIEFLAQNESKSLEERNARIMIRVSYWSNKRTYWISQ